MRVVIADLKSRDGFVNKDTIVGGFGSRFRGFTWTTRWIERVRTIYQNVPSIHSAYLAAIFSSAGHEVIFTDERPVDGDLGLVLTSIVDYRHEIRWAEQARRSGMRVGFFGAMATHATKELENHADFVIKGEPEAAAQRLAQANTWRECRLVRRLSTWIPCHFPRGTCWLTRGRHTLSDDPCCRRGAHSLSFRAGVVRNFVPTARIA